MKAVNINELILVSSIMLTDPALKPEYKLQLEAALNNEFEGNYCPKCGYTSHKSLHGYIICSHCKAEWFTK